MLALDERALYKHAPECLRHLANSQIEVHAFDCSGDHCLSARNRLSAGSTLMNEQHESGTLS
jgi:hypothetical protein